MPHRADDSDDAVARLAIGDAVFWLSTAGSAGQRIPTAIGGATGRTLLVIEDPGAVLHHAVTAGATAPRQTNTAGGLPGSPAHSATNEKIGHPLGAWPPP